MNTIFKDIRKLSHPERAKHSLRFFKTSPGQYGHGDQFLGLTVPESRKIAIKYSNIDLKTLNLLIASPWHEERLIGLLILVHNYEFLCKQEHQSNLIVKKNPSDTKHQLKIKFCFKTKEQIIKYYLKSKKHINNWDLVDLTAYKILGHYYLNNYLYATVTNNNSTNQTNQTNQTANHITHISHTKQKKQNNTNFNTKNSNSNSITNFNSNYNNNNNNNNNNKVDNCNSSLVLLNKLIRSNHHWDRRIAMVSTLAFIKKGHPEIAFKFAECVLKDPEDLMHKASGWMLREAGKKDLISLKNFIRKNYFSMPRTMLRYSIEKFPEKERKQFLLGNF